MNGLIGKCFLAIAVMAACVCGANSVPDWLDTTAPVITILPENTWQNNVFLVTIQANEPARIWYRINTRQQWERYRNPLTVSNEGRTVVYYYAEDDFGNKTPVDSAAYILDQQAPVLAVTPPQGRYRSAITVTVSAGKACRIYRHAAPGDESGETVQDSFVVTDRFEGYISAVDSAGNRATSGKLSYIVDSIHIAVEITPEPGIYNRRLNVAFDARPSGDIYYTFDPHLPLESFQKYRKPSLLPAGLTVVRYFARTADGWESEVGKATFVIDTVPPRLRMQLETGENCDTLKLWTREVSVIRYTFDERLPDESSPIYKTPLVIPRKDRAVVWAVARDGAGNESDVLKWSRQYDFTAPLITLSPEAGIFTGPVRIAVGSSKPARVFCTLDGTPASEKSNRYEDGIVLSREGITTLRCIGMDMAGNVSREVTGTYTIDTRPPVVKAKIEKSADRDSFTVFLAVNENATIYYETGDAIPTKKSPVYRDGVGLRPGEVLRYFAVDKAGNAGEVVLLDETRKPMVSVKPEGGIYNRRVGVTFIAGGTASVYWRIFPDTLFARYTDTIALDESGSYLLEYYSETPAGVRGVVNRNTYVVDTKAPNVNVTIKKGHGDSALILFESDENASIYFTLDGTNPFYSQTTRMLGNKFTRSSDRLLIPRRKDMQLAFYAEDVAGNQSGLAILDVFKPRAVPNIPAGPGRIYDRVLSVQFSTYDQSIIYFARHGNTPTIDSSIYREPITLLQSDTICAFVVDASGMTGEIDTFVYLIDLPPSPQFSVAPSKDSVVAGHPAFFDASKTVDRETPLARLRFRWDFDGDGAFDTDTLTVPVATFTYGKTGLYVAMVEVIDEGGRVATSTREVRVRGLCPAGMVYIVDDEGMTFCIDRYEWPNVEREKPLTRVSWVEAKMMCLDAGKRLCTAREWRNACRGFSRHLYPYGLLYEPARCATEGKGPFDAGSFPECGEGFGLRDMVGNAWEWVEDRNGDYPVIVGGSYRQSSNAHCDLRSAGTVATQSEDIGFRCCK